MFRDLKEYQEIAKIYADKVSKPENLEENQANRMKMKQQRTAQNKGRFEKQIAPLKPKPIQGRISPSSQNMAGKPKPMPTTAEIRAKDDASGGSGMSNIPSKEGNAVIDGKKLNPDFGKKVNIKKEFPDKVDSEPLTKKQKFDKKFIKKDKGVGFVKRGTPAAQRAENKERARNRAKEMAKANIEKKKTAMEQALIPIIKPSMPLIRNKKTGEYMTTDGKPFDIEKFKDNYNKNKNKTDKTDVKSSYEYDAYDLVLEYLLSSEQVATIEEANYVMTEMDAETIQSIVEAQKKTS